MVRNTISVFQPENGIALFVYGKFLDGFKLVIVIFDLSLTIFPFHLLGLKGLIGVIAMLPELRDKIGP